MLGFKLELKAPKNKKRDKSKCMLSVVDPERLESAFLFFFLSSPPATHESHKNGYLRALCIKECRNCVPTGLVGLE